MPRITQSCYKVISAFLRSQRIFLTLQQFCDLDFFCAIARALETHTAGFASLPS